MPPTTSRLRSATILAVLVLLVTTACTSRQQRRPPTSTAASSTTASGTASPDASSPLPPPTVQFSDCSAQFQAAINNAAARTMAFSCGKLAVPLDHANPRGTRIALFVLKVHSKSQRAADRIGSLVVNPGGPGGSGINLAAGLVGALSGSIFEHFDLVGFDPRGVGLSDPLHCVTDRQKDVLSGADPDPRTSAGRAAAKVNAESVVKGCTQAYGSALANFNTEETARDLDLVRQAVGDTRLNYLGFSYGTRLGAVYAHDFPGKLRAAVLDGAVDPIADELTTDQRQAQALETAFDQFAADCLTRPSCAPLANPRQVVESLIATANRSPIRSSRKGETRLATGGIVTLAVRAAMYDRTDWAALGSALLSARVGDAAGLFALSDSYLERDPATGHYSNLMDANLAITCNDSATQFSDAQVATKATTWMASYPIFGRQIASSLYTCATWPPSGHPVPPSTAPGAPPILVIGTLRDPATPYAGAPVLARTLGTGVLLTWNGEGNNAYPKTGCIRSKVDSYLITGRPPTGDSCPGS